MKPVPTDLAKPVDYSFRNYYTLEEADLEEAREHRIGSIPDRNVEGSNKFLTNAILVNNNYLKTTENLDVFVDSIVDRPESISWLDFSFNRITEICGSVLHYRKLSILYFHGNKISDPRLIFMLRHLRKLRHVTFHGNPISKMQSYRRFVIFCLPQIKDLDFQPILKSEKFIPPHPNALKVYHALVDEENYLSNFCKYKCHCPTHCDCLKDAAIN